MKNNIAVLLIAALFISFISCEKLSDTGNIVSITEDINSPTIWEGSKIYVIENSIYVNANLTIEAGAEIRFKGGAWMAFGYSNSMTIRANGTADKPIIFTSDAATPAAGAWQSLWFYGGVLSNSSLSFVEVRYAGGGSYPAISMDKPISITNSKIVHSRNHGIEAKEGFEAFTGNTIENVGTHAIVTAPEYVHTIGNNNTIVTAPSFGIRVFGGTISGAPRTWRKQSVGYHIEGGIWVETNLTLEAGTTLKFDSSAWLNFGNVSSTTLTAIGTTTEPVVFTSSATTPARGAYVGLFFDSNTSPNSVMRHCIIEYGGKDWDRANIRLNGVNGLTIENSVIRQSSGYGLVSHNSTWNNVNNTFSDNAMGDIAP